MNVKPAKYKGRQDRHRANLKHGEWAEMPNEYLVCEVHNDCLACPLSICKWDDLSWFHRSVRMGRCYAMAEMRRAGASAEATASVFGVSVRTVYGSIAKVNKLPISPGDRAVFARLARNLPEALHREPPLPQARPCRDCGEDITERGHRAKLCYRCSQTRNWEKNRKVEPSAREESPADCVRVPDPVLPDRYLPRQDLYFTFEMGLE